MYHRIALAEVSCGMPHAHASALNHSSSFFVIASAVTLRTITALPHTRARLQNPQRPSMLNMAAARLSARPDASTGSATAAAVSNAHATSPAGASAYTSAPFANHPLKALKLNIDKGSRDGYLYVPPTYTPNRPSPLLIMLHGAGGHGKNTLATFGELSVFDNERCLLLVPESRSNRSWDMIRGGFGPDVEYINCALDYVFSTYRVDPNRLGIAGFSDGASYALSLGLPNGDLFSHIVAFSPGFMRPPSVAGNPRVYISHGVYDEVLGIDNCSRRLLPSLKQMLPKSEMHYVEFAGPHVVRADISSEALDWFLTGVTPEDTTYSRGG